MSQKFVIEKVSVTGATPFLGRVDNSDPDSEMIFSRQPDCVMEWLTAAWRTRFNAYRSRRKKYGANGELLPLGKNVDERTPKQARAEQSWLTSVPSLLLDSSERVENAQWFAAIARRKTLLSKGQNPGKMPRFRSAKKDDEIFTVWFNGGRGATIQKVNRKHAIVFIRGMNPAGYRLPGEKASFTIRIHIRLSQPIRPYTSIQVNWTRKTLVVTNPAPAIERKKTGDIGIDLGVKHNMADSEGRFYDLDRDKLAKIDREVRLLQRSNSRSTTKGVRFAQRSKRISTLKAKAHNIVRDSHEKWSLDLAQNYDTIFLEDLKIKNMVRKGRGKRGLNRLLHEAAFGQITQLLTDKAKRSQGVLIKVDPKNTSRHCPECGHTSSDNRKSQAVFSCIKCGHTANADTNAARNILTRGLKTQGRAYPSGEGSKTLRAAQPHPRASSLKREPTEPSSRIPSL